MAVSSGKEPSVKMREVFSSFSSDSIWCLRLEIYTLNALVSLFFGNMSFVSNGEMGPGNSRDREYAGWQKGLFGGVLFGDRCNNVCDVFDGRVNIGSFDEVLCPRIEFGSSSVTEM